jgi:hypothetical protein
MGCLTSLLVLVKRNQELLEEEDEEEEEAPPKKKVGVPTRLIPSTDTFFPRLKARVRLTQIHLKRTTALVCSASWVCARCHRFTYL